MKKLLATLLMFTLVLSLFAGLTLAAHADYRVFWTEELADGTIRIEYSTDTVVTSMDIPPVINGKRITELADNCFMNYTQMASVTIPEGITRIGCFAFSGCDSLKSITLPASVTEIGEGCFYSSGLSSIEVSPDNKAFTSVDGVLYSKDMKTLISYPPKKDGSSYRIPNGVETICGYAFSCCLNLKEVFFPDSLHTLEHRAFYINVLQRITLPDKLYFIGENAFENSNYLESIVIPDSVVSLGIGSFHECTNLRSAVLPSSLSEIPASLFEQCYFLSDVVIPDSVTSIGGYAFEDCSLQNIHLPDGLTRIESGAFYRSSISQIRLPAGLTDLALGAVSGVARIDVDDQNPVFSSVGGVLFSKDQTVLIQYPSQNPASFYEIPSGVTEIAPSAFNDAYFEHISIPDSVTTLGSEAFWGCNLKDVTIPAGITVISDHAFCYSQLQSITFLGDITDIGSGAFFQSGLVSVNLPNSVKTIGEHAFDSCPLVSVNLPDSIETIESEAFYWCKQLEHITLPKDLKHLGSAVFANCDALEEISVPYGLTTIPTGTFYGCDRLRTVTLPITVSVIDSGAFSDCNAIASVNYGGSEELWQAINISDNNDALLDAGIRCSGVDHSDALFNFVQEPGKNELYLCSLSAKAQNYSSLSLPETFDGLPIRYIGCGVFAEHPALKRVSIPSGVKYIGNEAFANCQNLHEIALPDSLTEIGKATFCNCINLCDVTIPDTVTGIGEAAFQNCASLTQITLPSNLTALGNAAFDNCRSLESIRIPDGIEFLNSEVFAFCSSLQQVEFSENLVMIDSDAFTYCKQLRDVYLPKNLQYFDLEAFRNCSSIRWMYLPKSLCEIRSPYTSMDSLKDVYFEGSEAQWNSLLSDFENSTLSRVSVHFNSIPAVGDFLDVRAGDWFCDSVAYAYEKGLMNGTGDYIFSPSDSLTRAQLVTILYRMKGEPEVSFRGTFSDVAPGLWYSDAIEWAAANGIVNGYEGGTFKPSTKITREQIATILYRLEGSPEASGTLTFPDAGTVSGYAVDAMRWAVSEGLINGVASGGVTNLAPKNSATRAQIAAIIMRYQEGSI